VGTRSWHLAAALLLVALLGIVATLQYRWLGDISRAERERLQSSLQTRASEFEVSLDGDVTRAYAAFDVDPTMFAVNPAAALSEAAARAGRESATGNAIKAIFVAEPGVEARVKQFDTAAGTLEPAEWPSELQAIGQRIAAAPSLAIGGVPLPPGFMGEALDGEVPALIVPVVSPEPPVASAPGEMTVRTLPSRSTWRAVVVWLDAGRLSTGLVAPMVSRYFGDGGESDFNVSVVSREVSRVQVRLSFEPYTLAPWDRLAKL